MEEILQNESGKENEVDGVRYIEAINEMKKNTVPREQFEKLRDENVALLKSLMNGDVIDQPVAKEPADLNKMRNDLYNGEHKNLEYVRRTLELRDALIEQGHPDPFLPHGHNVPITQNDVECAERVAAAFKHCVEYADGDSAVFTNELMRITRDTFNPNQMKRRR